MKSPAEKTLAWLIKLAPSSAKAWQAASAHAFHGEVSVETTNSLYRFKNGVFISRMRSPSRSFDAPRAMRGLRLLGFLVDEGGFWSLSVRWTEGSHAVMWKPLAEGQDIDETTFTLTSATTSIAMEDPEPSPWALPVRAHEERSRSGVHTRRIARPPSIRALEPPSMTRIHADPPPHR